MKRQMRRSLRKFERKLSQAKSYFGRSNSEYQYTHRSTYVPSPVSSAEADSDDDHVFRAITNDSPMGDTEDTSTTSIPCEFCHVQQTMGQLVHHQMLCPQNPNYPRRRNLTPNRAPHGRRRRAISDSTSPAPSAPARTRSPSPTEGYPIPAEYQCPITHVLFTDPVVASDGHTYERSAIVRWLKTQKVSPVTRGAISIDTLNPNRIVKKMVDDFRAECKRKRALYKYRLDIDVKKSEEVPYIKINTKSIYRAEWINKNSSSADSNIILIHLTGDNAEKIAETYCRLGPHPNIVRVFGRVEHSDNGILLLKECPPAKTLAQVSEQKLSIAILDHIFYQIASALEHLNNAEIVHGNVTDENIFIYHLDAIPEDTLIKLTDIDDTEKSTDDKIIPETLSANLESEESDVYAFGVLAKEMYLLELETSTERQALFERCLSIEPNERPTFNELTKALNDFIIKSKCI